MKVSEMLKSSEQTDREVCEQADKLAVEDYFESNADPNAELKIEECNQETTTVTIDPQEEKDDWEVLQDE